MPTQATKTPHQHPVSKRLLLATRQQARHAHLSDLKNPMFMEAMKTLLNVSQSEHGRADHPHSEGLRALIERTNPVGMDEQTLLFIITAMIQHHKNKRDPQGRNESNRFFKSIHIQRSRSGDYGIQCGHCKHHDTPFSPKSRPNNLAARYPGFDPVSNAPHAYAHAYSHYRQVHEDKHESSTSPVSGSSSDEGTATLAPTISIDNPSLHDAPYWC